MTTMTFDENLFTEPFEPAETTPKPKKTQAKAKRKDNTNTVSEKLDDDPFHWTELDPTLHARVSR